MEAAYGLGVNASMAALRAALPDGAAVIGNYGASTPRAALGDEAEAPSLPLRHVSLARASGLSLERAGAGASNVALLQAWGAAGLLVEFHVQCPPPDRRPRRSTREKGDEKS